MVDVTQDIALMLECLQFVQDQSSGQWGEFIEQEDAKKLAAFVARHRDAEAARTERHRNDMADKIVDQRTEIAALKAHARTLPKGSVEKVARAICAAENGGPIGYFPDGSPMRSGGVWHEYVASQHAEWHQVAQAALASLGMKEEGV